MPSMERHERGDPNTSPALGVTDQYSKGRPSGQRELAAACEAGLALHRAGEKWAAVEAALRMLTAADGLGFRRALLFLLASDGTALAGAAAARRVRPSRQPGEERAREGMLDERLTNAIRAMRFSTGTEKESPLLRVMAEGHPVRLTASELQGCLDGDRHRLPGVRAWWLLPVTGSGQPLGILLLEEAGRGPWTSRAQLAKRLAAHLGQTIVQREGERALLETTAKLRTLRESVRELLAAGTLPDLLQLAARAGLRSAGGGCALLWTYDERTHQLDLAVHLPAAKEHSLEEWLPHLDPLAQAALLSGAVRRYPDLRAEEGFGLGGHPYPLPALCFPLMAFGDLVGIYVLVHMRGPAGDGAGFTAEEEALAGVFAGYAAVAIANARLGERVRQGERQLRETQGALLRAEKLAALGDLAVEQARDIRPALAAIAGFARRLQRELRDEAQGEYLQVMLREVKHIGDLLQEQERVARQSEPRLAMCQLNELCRASLAAIHDQLRERGIVLEEAYSEQLPELLLDPERVAQMIANILRGALDGLKRAEILRLETLLQGEWVLLEIAHTGASLPGEALEQLFCPFTTVQASGPGLGLALAHQIVKEHGGEISVRGEEDWSTIFTITFPIAQNQERRRGPDRRRGGERRGRSGNRGD